MKKKKKKWSKEGRVRETFILCKALKSFKGFFFISSCAPLKCNKIVDTRMRCWQWCWYSLYFFLWVVKLCRDKASAIRTKHVHITLKEHADLIIKMRKKDENSQLKYAHNTRSWQRQWQRVCMWNEQKKGRKMRRSWAKIFMLIILTLDTHITTQPHTCVHIMYARARS